MSWPATLVHCATFGCPQRWPADTVRCTTLGCPWRWDSRILPEHRRPCGFCGSEARLLDKLPSEPRTALLGALSASVWPESAILSR